MSIGKSIHIGLNHVDPEAYGGWDGELAGCLNDARDMCALAEREGFDPTLLTDSDATASAAIAAIASEASQLKAGDILLIDSTHFTTLFGGTDSLASLWRNLAMMK